MWQSQHADYRPPALTPGRSIDGETHSDPEDRCCRVRSETALRSQLCELSRVRPSWHRSRTPAQSFPPVPGVRANHSSWRKPGAFSLGTSLRTGCSERFTRPPLELWAHATCRGPDYRPGRGELHSGDLRQGTATGRRVRALPTTTMTERPAPLDIEQAVTTDILPRVAGPRWQSPGRVEQSGVFAGLSSRRSRVQIPSCPPPQSARSEVPGQVAQSVERRSEKPEVDGSTPSLTTIQSHNAKWQRHSETNRAFGNPDVTSAGASNTAVLGLLLRRGPHSRTD